MRRALFEAWRQTVDETDVIICLGDVTVGPANPPIDEALAALPGETILVAGNHDVAGGGKDYGFEAAYGVCAGFDAQGRDIGQLRERMAHFEGPPRADVRTDAPDRGRACPAICCACSRVPPFERYAVIPVALNVWQQVEGGRLKSPPISPTG